MLHQNANEEIKYLTEDSIHTKLMNALSVINSKNEFLGTSRAKCDIYFYKMLTRQR